MEVDSDYEFNAPRYIDFLSNEDDNEHTDTWFDENPEGHEGGIRLSHVPFVGQHSNFQEATRAISAALADSEMEQSMQTSKVGQENEAAEPEATKSMPVIKNELQTQMTSDTVLAEEKEEKSEIKPEPIEDTRQQHEEEEKQQSVEDATQKVALQVNVKEEISETEKVEGDAVEKVQENVTVEKDESKMGSKSLKRRTRSNSSNQEKISGSKLRKRKSSFTPSKLAQIKGGATNMDDSDAVGGKKAKVEMKKPLITMPNTPSFIRRLRGKTNQEKKTSEALEIERIKKLQEETKKHLKSNESYLQKALAPQPVHQAKLATEVTKTIEFNFATDSRIKQHPMKTRGDKSENTNFVGQLRKHPPSPTFKNRKPTKAVPFKFSSSSSSSFHKETKSDQVGKWQSVASAVSDFQTKTPERWRTRPASQQNSGPQIDDKNKTKMELTHPKTPQLMTRGRSRPLSAPSQADLELKTAEEMASYKFKAREFDHKIVERDGMYGVEPLKQLPITEAKPFSFSSDKRLEQRKKQEEEKKEQEKIAKQQQQQQQAKPGDKRNTSMDYCSGRKRPKITEPKPFSFETRDKQMAQKKQEKIKKVYEEEEKAREFTARPLPSLSPDLIPVKPGKHTEIAAFNLATDERGAVRMEKWTAQISKELEEEKEKTTFKAQPCTVVHKEAFKPKPAAKPLVEVSDFKLNTEERSKKREDYEIMKKEQQRIKEDEMQLFLKEKKEEEEREIANLRKQAIHKANPIRNFGEFQLQPCDRPLTFPETPKFETNKRFGKQSRV